MVLNKKNVFKSFIILLIFFLKNKHTYVYLNGFVFRNKVTGNTMWLNSTEVLN